MSRPTEVWGIKHSKYGIAFGELVGREHVAEERCTKGAEFKVVPVTVVEGHNAIDSRALESRLCGFLGELEDIYTHMPRENSAEEDVGLLAGSLKGILDDFWPVEEG